MADVKETLRRLLGELDAEDDRESIAELRRELDELKNRPGLSREELDAILDARDEARQAEREAAEQEQDDDSGDGSEGASGDDSGSNGDSGRKPRTRPGRRSGQVYAWDVDDDGKVVKLDVAKVYNGPDEPDRVELAAKSDDGDDGDGGDD